jgi:hypothetical protein
MISKNRSMKSVSLAVAAVGAFSLLATAQRPAVAAAPALSSDAQRVYTAMETILTTNTAPGVVAATLNAIPDLEARTRYKNAVWELYKGKKGIDIDAAGHELKAPGKPRRRHLKDAMVAIGTVTEELYTVAKLAKHDLLQGQIEELFNNSMQHDGDVLPDDAVTNLSGRAIVCLNGAFNAIHIYLPEQTPGWPRPLSRQPVTDEEKAAWEAAKREAATHLIDIDERIISMREDYLFRLPSSHRAKLYDIFIMDKKPGDPEKGGGGTWKKEAMGVWRTNPGVSKVPWADLLQLLETEVAGGTEKPIEGVIGIPANRIAIVHDIDGNGDAIWGYTITHEAGHSIDYAFDPTPTTAPSVPTGLQTGAPSSALPGQKYNGTVDPGWGERVAEAYSRYFMRNLAMCQVVPTDSTQKECTKTCKKYLKTTVAFDGIDIPIEN